MADNTSVIRPTGNWSYEEKLNMLAAKVSKVDPAPLDKEYLMATEVHMPARILLGPGPSLVDPRVLRAMAAPLVGHLDPSFLTLMDITQKLLRYTFQTESPLTIPISGTGSAAMEAAVVNMVERGNNVLVCVNGYFGNRLADMANRCGGVVRTINRPWGDIFTPDQVREALHEQPAKVVAIVQAETSTGALQPVDEIAKIVHDQGGILIVDAVTSLGGVPLNFDLWDLDVAYSGTQKCLSCPPGLGPITLGPRAVEVLKNRKTQVPNWYLDLTMVEKYWGNERTYHHTAPITAIYGLYEGLRIVAEEGLENRWNRHRQNAALFWDGLADLGLACHVPESHRLPSLTTVRVPEGVNEGEVRSRLLQEYNIEIAGGLGELKGKVWRVGLMGFSSRRENVITLLEAFRRLLNR
jgi:alanine-glyoxylate transaminase/serine-glyoxylate transaminase/serine-pyruvate transaminase